MPSSGRLVVVSQRVTEVPAYGERRDCLDQQWAVWLQSLGLITVPVPNRLTAAALCKQLHPVGVVLSGGNNLASPVYDGAVEAVPDAYPDRDETETQLVEYAIRHRLPVLGCCRGMQFLQAHFGGRLADITGSSVRHVAATHDVGISDERLRVVVGAETLVVNSFHNYGIPLTALAPPLVPFGVSGPDQTVEAFIHEDLPIVGIMWHPERPNPASIADAKLANALFGRHRTGVHSWRK